jgi:hypothetical protein
MPILATALVTKRFHVVVLSRGSEELAVSLVPKSERDLNYKRTWPSMLSLIDLPEDVRQ